MDMIVFFFNFAFFTCYIMYSLKITHGKLFRFFFLSLKTRIRCYLFIVSMQHVESYFPIQGLNLYSRHWKNRILTTALP